MDYTILIADDEPLEREALEKLLKRHAPGDARILVAPNGTVAAELGSAQPVDIALLDIRMPGMSGLEAAGVIRERNPDARLVFLSAFDYFEYAREAIRLRAEDYLIKPVEDEAVVRVLNRLVQDLSRAAGSHTERLQEATRFVESEIMDDMIQGEAEPEMIKHALNLLEIEDTAGYALVVQPDLERYPFRLETTAQKRAVVLRYMRALRSELSGVFRRMLLRARPEEGILLCLQEKTPSGEEAIRAALARLPGTTGLSSVFELSRRFETILTVPEILPGLRRTLRLTHREGVEMDSRTVQRLFTALLKGEEERARSLTEQLWLEILPVSRESSPRDSMLEILCYLRQSARMQGVTPPELAIRESTAIQDRDELRSAFTQEVLALLQRDNPVENGQTRAIRFWMEQHYCEAVTLSELAAHLGVSVHHCSRTVSRALGVPFSRYLNTLRVRRAGELLATTTMTVKEIADQTGFREPNYLSRVFTELEGISPTEFRSQRRTR